MKNVIAAFFLCVSFIGMFKMYGEKIQLVNGVSIYGTLVDETMQTTERKIEELRLERKAQEEAKENETKTFLLSCIEKMTLEEKLAQMMIMTHEKDMTLDSVGKYQPGGIIFFGFDFNGKTMEQVRERVDVLQEASKIPMLICVDEEGGEISRVSGLRNADNANFQSARSLGDTRDKEYIKEQTNQKMELLKVLGINVNFDPVADITTNPAAYMYRRSAGGEASQVADYVSTVVEQMRQDNMISCMKHFPGYGDNGNTHVNYIIDDRALSQYEEMDFVPFKAGVQSGSDMIMVSHIVMKAFNKKTPASLSKKVHKYLRNDIGFEGVIITDDLNMAAVMNQMNLVEASCKALEAGNDMLFSADIIQSMEGAKKALEKGTVTEEQINESVYRILKMKYDHQLITRGEE